MITVMTPTLPERGTLLAELAESIGRQSLPPAQWLVEWDFDRVGPVDMVNRMAAKVTTPWLFPMGDDDLFYDDHFDTLRPFLTDNADVVYSWCRVEGRWQSDRYQVPFEKAAVKMGRENLIPGAACIRTEMWRALGGYQRPDDQPHEDHDFWKRAVAAGATFVCVPVVTWVYRMGAWNHHSEGGGDAGLVR